jgi:hypothetical protein
MTTGTELAETPATTDSGTTIDKGAETATPVSHTDDNGIMDLDAMADAQDGGSGDIEDGSLEGDDPEADEAKAAAAKLAEEPAETPEEKAKKLSGAQRSKIERQRLLDQITERDREIEKLKAGPVVEKPAVAAGVDPNMPKEADFNGDYFAYTEARTAYVAAKAVREAAEGVFKSHEDAARIARENERQQVIQAAHLERVVEAKTIIADFDEVIGKMQGVDVDKGLADLLQSSDKGPLLAYHYAQNPSDFGKLQQMSRIEQAYEVGRLAGELKYPERKTQTKADPPLSKVRGGAPPAKSQERELAAFLDKKYPNRKK